MNEKREDEPSIEIEKNSERSSSWKNALYTVHFAAAHLVDRRILVKVDVPFGWKTRSPSTNRPHRRRPKRTPPSQRRLDRTRAPTGRAHRSRQRQRLAKIAKIDDKKVEKKQHPPTEILSPGNVGFASMVQRNEINGY